MPYISGSSREGPPRRRPLLVLIYTLAFTSAPPPQSPEKLSLTSLSPLSKKSTLDNQSNPVQLWNEKVRSYVAVIENSSYTSTEVTHYGLYHLQSLRESMQPLLDDGYKLTGGSRNSTDFQYPAFSDDLLAYEDGSKLNDEQKFSHVFSQAKFDVAKAYEEGQQWKELLTQDDLDFINAEVDHALMGRWGMEIVTTALAAGKQASKVGDRLEHHRRLTFLDHAMMR